MSASWQPEMQAGVGQHRREWISALAKNGVVPEVAELGIDDVPAAWADQAGYSDEVQLRALAKTLNLDFFEDLNDFHASAEFVRNFEINFARGHHVLGMTRSDAGLHLAICDMRGWSQLDVVRRILGSPVEPVLTRRESLLAAVNAAYEDRTGQAQELIDTLDSEDVFSELEELDRRQDLLDTSSRAPVVKLVNLLLFEAVKARASDIHIQPYEDRVVARQRIDGVLFDSHEVPKALQEEVVTRIKVLGRMDIAEKRLPQDGRATVQVGDRIIDLRISSLPTSHNERIVIRLLDKSARLYTLGEVGMPAGTLKRFRQLIGLDHGLILVTGPTGSGKSTTLYAALQELNTTDQNVLTLEDPIEYQLDGISQIQINEKKGMTFASGLRSVLRQDPDIIMVGEIRDSETAVMAIQASLTGHLVFSTLHTNDAASAVTRLLDLGIEPYLAASSMVAALAQRLVRRICNRCEIGRALADARQDRELQTRMALQPPDTVGLPCNVCHNTGYHGRIGLFELLVMDDRIRELVQQSANAAEIREAALHVGMTLLEMDGMHKVESGSTTVTEVIRVAESPTD